MRLGILGPLAVWTDDGRPVAVPGLKVRALLADLLVHEGRPVPADRLIDDLWGETPPGNPAGALSAKVSQLRRIFEDAEAGARARVAHRPAGYLLRTDDDQVDAIRFRGLVARALESADPRGRAAGLADALALWRGPVLADFADEPFAQPVIARLTELRLTALEDHAEVRLALGEHGVLAGELGDLLAAHPLRERLRAAHMRALYRAGRQTEALESYEALRGELADQLGLDPSAGLSALRQAILTQDPSLEAPAVAPAPAPPSAATPRPRTNLRPPATGIVGRDGALAEVASRLEADRLVTLTGPGGVGKTRLGVEIATRLVDAFPDGVWMVELAGLPGARGVEPPTAGTDVLVDAVMRVLDLRDAPGRDAPIDRLADVLRARRLLLVLDNCEHIVEEVAELVERLLGTVPGLRVLATGREPLSVAGEVVWTVSPLEVPDPTAEADPTVLTRSSAVRLFVERAAAASRGFRLADDTAQAVAVLCRRLDGIPLALELAATRVRALGVHGLVDRLDDRFRLLATGHRGAPLRQRTLMAMIDWSWELLSEPERLVLRRLAVHADGCSPEAAEAVCSDDDLPAVEVLDHLLRLVDRSLVVMTEDRDGPRYRLLESVAAYCDERMADAGEHERVRDAHHRHYLELAETAAPHLRGGDQARWLRLLDTEAANLRAALNGAVASGHAGPAQRLANALAWYWFLRGRLTEARRSLETVLTLDGGPAAERARATAWHAGFSLIQGDGSGQDAALKSFESVHDPAGLATAQWFVALTGSEVADITGGLELLDRALEGFRATGDRWGEAATLILRSKYAHSRGETATLRREVERAADLFGALGDRWGQLQAAEWLAAHAELTGDYEGADRLQCEGLQLAEELRLWPDVAVRLGWLGWIAMMRCDYRRARDYGERALRLGVEQGHRMAVTFAHMGLGLTARRQGDLETAETHLHILLKDVPPEEDAPPPLYLPLIQVGLGYAAERRGDAFTALARHRDALAVAVKFDGPRDTAFALEGLAGALTLAGRPGHAARLLGAAATVRRTCGLAPGPAEREDIDRIRTSLLGALSPDEFDAEHARGMRLSPATCLDEVREVRALRTRARHADEVRPI